MQALLNFALILRTSPLTSLISLLLKNLSKLSKNLHETAELKAVVVTSSKSGFIVGADITEFLTMFKHSEEELKSWLHQANTIFNAFEDLPVPTAAAINGIALGGGLEMCLCCDFRVGSESALVGVPETQLGLIPRFRGNHSVAKTHWFR